MSQKQCADLIQEVPREPRAHEQLTAAHNESCESTHDEVGRHRCDCQQLFDLAVRIDLLPKNCLQSGARPTHRKREQDYTTLVRSDTLDC